MASSAVACAERAEAAVVEYREVFAFHDGDYDGRLTTAEFCAAVRSLGHAPTAMQVRLSALAASARWPCARRARRARGASLPRQHFLCAKGQCLCVAALTASSSHAPPPSRAARRFARHRRAHLPGRCVCAPTFVAADVVANARAARFTAISTPAFCPASPPSCPPNAHEQAWPLPTSSRCLGRLLSRRSLARLRWRRQPARGWRRLSSCAAGN